MSDQDRPPFGSEPFVSAVEAALEALERWRRARRYRKAQRHLQLVESEPPTAEATPEGDQTR